MFSLHCSDRKFRDTCRIDDFEFTPECAIFDLLDIPLYHGWIVDPQVCTSLASDIPFGIIYFETFLCLKLKYCWFLLFNVI